MSKYITEIVADIKANPKSWKRYKEDGLQKDEIIIGLCGNGHKLFFLWATSLVVVITNGNKSFGLTFYDKYQIEEAFLWWNRNATLKMMLA